MKTLTAVACLVALLAPLTAARSQGNSWTNEVPAEAAKDHLHERAAVFGKVYHVSWDSNVYLDFDGFYTKAVFSAVLPNAAELVSQLATLEGKEVVIHGRITTNAFGIPQIRVKTVANILIVGADNHAVPLDLSPAEPAPPANPAPRENTASWLSVFAADPDETNTIVTLSGKTYQYSKVIQVEPDGLTIKYASAGGGLAETKLTFDELSPDIQQMYGYDPQIAAAYINEKQQAADLATAEERRREWRLRHDQLIAQAAAARRLYETTKRAYDQDKADYDGKLRLGSLHDAQRLAAAQELQAREAAYQSAVQHQAFILQQQQLNLMQQTNFSSLPAN